ncbi:MAG: DUF3177 family protein [Heteroscytonema crispum UTEX LB 1556]
MDYHLAVSPQEVWFRPLVWMDYRLAILFAVIIPLILTIWAFVQKAESMQRLLFIYWRVASLLAITVYLMIAEFGISFISGLMARILIPISLWFWLDLNDDIEYQQSGPLKLVFTSWRWAISVYCTLGAIAYLPFLGCAFSKSAIASPNCRVWLEAPLLFKEYFHPNSKPGFLGFLGIVGLIIYVLYLSYFVLVKLGKQGRSATQQ